MCDSVGRPKHVRVMAGALEGDLFIGPKAEVPQKHNCQDLYSDNLVTIAMHL